MSVARAAEILRAGGLVGLPTETVYGLGCDATNARAVARLFAIKARPTFNPLISHVLDRAGADRHGIFDARAERLASAFWPGPLTLVLKRRADSPVCDLACAGLDTIGLRAPAHALMREVLSLFGGPIAAPSANRSGAVSPTTVAHVRADLGADIDLVLDGGPARFGLESTIVALIGDAPPSLLRPGAIARDAIEALIGPLASPAQGALAAPGMLASHYAPRARLRLNATGPGAGEAYLAFGAPTPSHALSLSATGDLTEAAANLYAHLRALDAGGAAVIAVAPIPMHGRGEGINDRLARAAAPR